MPKIKNETQTFRHRGFQMQDSTGKPVPDAPVVMIYGSDPEPVSPADGTTFWAKIWDHTVTEQVQVTDYVAPADPAPAV